MAGILPVLAWGGALLLAAHASGCDPSEEPPKPEPKRPEPPQPTDGVEAQKKLQEITAPAQPPAPAGIFRALQKDSTHLLALDTDRAENIFAQLCPGVKESVEKDRASVSQEDFKREGVWEKYWPQVGQKPTDKALFRYYRTIPDGEDTVSARCKMLSVDPRSVNTWFTLGVVLKNREEPEKAQQAYDVASAIGRVKGDREGLSYSMLVSARRYLNQGETFRAIDLYEAVLNLRKVNISYYYPRLSEELEEKWPENISYDEGRETIKRLKAEEE